MNKLRKFLVIGVMALTVLATMGVTQVKASASAGDLIKMDGLSSVYYLGSDGKRYVFPNEATYMSWYSDFSGVVTITASELQSYPLGGNVTMRPGTKLVKITTDPSVYAVEPNGVLRKIQSEAQASALFGSNWNKRVVDVADSFFTNYTVGSALANGSIPAGSLVKNASGAEIFYFDGTNYRSIASETAFNANRFAWSNIIVAGSTVTAGGVALSNSEFVNVAQNGGTGIIVTGSGLMVSLNSSTPASQNVPGNSPVELMKINLTAANDGAVNVSSIKLTAYGLSAATNIDDVTFYDNGVKVGTAKSINSDRVALFNFATPISIAAGTTKTLSVHATIAADNGTYGLGIASASDILSSGATVSGSFPVVSNLMSAVQSSIGGLTIDSAAGSLANASFGEDNVLLADFTLAAGNSEDALVQKIVLYNGGTNDNGIVTNLQLFIDGNAVTTGSYSNRYATFTLNNYNIEKGKTVSVEVRGDMGITSANDHVKFYLKDSGDIAAVGKTHGFYLTITNTFPSTSLVDVTLTSGDFTIDMDKVATPAKDVKPGDTKVTLATLTLKTNGENATISNIAGSGFYITNEATTTTLIENAELVDLTTGSVYDLAIATSSTKHQLTMSDDISLVKGVAKKFAVRADILDIVPEANTFKVTLNANVMTVEGDVSGASITDITPSSISGSLITVKKASLTLTPVVLTNTNVVGGASDVVVYTAKVKAGSADGVRIQSLMLTSATSTELTNAFTDSNITKLDLYLNGNLLRTISNQINESAKTVTFNSLNTTYNTVAAGAEVDLVVKATFSSTVIAGDFVLSVDSNNDVTARSVTGSDTVVASTTSIDSRIVKAVSKGTLNVALVTTDTKANKDSFLLAGSQTEAGRYLGEIKFTTTNESVKVTALTLTGDGTATNQDIKEVKLVKADGTVVATQTVNSGADAVFDPFDISFSADQSTSLFVVAVAKGMNVDGDGTATARDGYTISYTLGAITATGVSSSEDITETTTGTGTSKVATVVGSKLNTIVAAGADGVLGGGADKIIGKYTFAFDNGSNRNTANEELKAILATSTITITKSTNVSITNAKMYIEGSAVNTADATGDNGTSTTALVFDGTALANLADAGKLDGTVTLVITATVTPSTDTGEFVQTSFADLNGSGSDDDVTYISNGLVTGTALTNMQLPVASVNGFTLSE